MQEALVREIKALQQYKASYDDLSRKFELIEHELQLRDQRHAQQLQLLQEKHDALAATNASLREELEAVKEESERARREVSQRGQRNHRIYRKLQQAAQLLEAREQEFEQSRAQLEQRLVLLQAETEAKDERIAALLQDNAHLRAHLEAETVPAKQFQELQNAHQEALYEQKVLEESLQALERELAIMKTSKSELQQHFNRAEKRVEELQGEVVASNRKLSQCAQKLQELQPELGESRREVETANAKVAELEKEKATLQHHLASTRVTLKALQDQRNELQRSLTEAQQQVGELTQRVQQLTQQLEAVKSERLALQSQHADLQDTGAVLYEEIRVLQGQYKALQQRYDKLDQSFQKQAITVDEINGENEMLTAKVCQLTKALSQKTKELQQLTTAHEAERRRLEALEHANASLVQEKLVLENTVYKQALSSNRNGSPPSSATGSKSRYSMRTPGLLRTQTSPITADTAATTARHQRLDELEAVDVLFSSQNSLSAVMGHDNDNHQHASNKATSLLTPPRRYSSPDRADASRFEEEISRLEGSLQTHLQDVTRQFS